MKNDNEPGVDVLPTTGVRAVAYVRVAVVEQSDSRSGLEAQAAIIRAFATSAGIELVRVFEDAGESAHNTRRPGLLAVLAKLETGQANMIIVSDLARLARDTRTLRYLTELFAGRGAILISATAAGRF